MSTHVITPTELEMFEQGYASLRMVCRKTLKSSTTVQRWRREEEVKTVRVASQHYYEIASVRKKMGIEACKRLGLDNWSDAVNDFEAPE